MVGADVARIKIPSGYGLINSRISTLGEGVIGQLKVGGLGIRGVAITGGATVTGLTATGKGAILDVLTYPSSVRLSENFTQHPLFGTEINQLTDLHTYLQTTAAVPAAEGKTNAGVIDRIDVRGSRDLGDVVSYSISNSNLNLANSISNIHVAGDQGSPAGGQDNKVAIDNLIVTTGQLTALTTDADVSELKLNVRGKIFKIEIGGDLRTDSLISTTGVSSDVNKILINGNVDGDISVSGVLSILNIGGDIDGNVIIGGGEGILPAINAFTLGGAYESGTFFVNGDVQLISVPGTLGTNPGLDQLIIQGDLGKLLVGQDENIDGSRLGLDLTVLGNLGKLNVQGEIIGSINVQGNINKLIVTADAVTQTSVSGQPILSGNVQVHGTMGKLVVTNGDVSSAVDVGQDINLANITSGSLQATARIRSTFGDILSLNITDGDLDGDLATPNGQIGAINLAGAGANIGATTSIDAEGISGTIAVAGSILAGASIVVTDHFQRLNVVGDVQAGVNLAAGTMQKLIVGGDLLGDLTVANNHTSATKAVISGDVGGSITTASDLKMTVLGDVIANTNINVGQDLLTFAITGDILAGVEVIVSGHGGTWLAGSIQDAVMTTGFDLSSLTVTGAISGTLIQTGMSPGSNGIFDGDASEVSRRGALGILAAGSIDNSVIAAGGSIDLLKVKVGTLTNTSVSTGLTIGSTAVAAIIADATPLATIPEQDAARNDGDRRLFHGAFGVAKVNQLVNSDLTAGVDAGTDGQFGSGDDGVLLNVAPFLSGGGRSQFNSVVVNISDGGSNVLADTGFVAQAITGSANTDSDVTYSLTDPAVIGLLAPNNSYLSETGVGAAIEGMDFSFDSAGPDDLVVSITGPGTVAIFDELTDTDNTISTLIISGTDFSSRITVTSDVPGTVDIRRILTGDDAQFKALIFDGALVGTGDSDIDLWLDGRTKFLELGTLGANVAEGQVGGDITTMTLGTQEDALLRVVGTINTLNINQGPGAVASDGIEAESISTLNVTGTTAYLGIVTTTGNSLGSANFAGSFGGDLVTSGDITSKVIIAGDLMNTGMISGADIALVKVAGDVAAGGNVTASGHLATFNHTGASFDGDITADSVGQLNFNGTVGNSATISVMADAGTVVVDGTFGGTLTAGSVSQSLQVNGSTQTTASITIDGDANSIQLLGGTQTGQKTSVDGHVNNLTVGGIHSGEIFSRLGMGFATFAETSNGLLAVGLDLTSVIVTGRAFDSLFSAGTWVGDDDVYNTDDDLLTGGSIGFARVTGQFVDSVVAAGVLPSLTLGSGILTDKRAYIGNADATSLSDFDSAEAGGSLVSRIGKFVLKQEPINTNRPNGQLSAVVAADGIDATKIVPSQVPLAIRTYPDTFGAPEVISSDFLSTEELEIVFSEPVNSASLILSVDANDDGDVVDVGDTQGTVTVWAPSIGTTVIDGLTGTYTIRVVDGRELGVLTLTSTTALPADLSVEVTGQAVLPPDFGTGPGQSVTIFDRSGLRSVLRDFNQDGAVTLGEDVSGTIPGGSQSSGGDSVSSILADSVGDDFATALDIGGELEYVAVVDIVADQLTLGSGHGLVTGDAVVYSNGGGVDIGGLTDGLTYFVVVVDDAAGVVQLATSFANATLPVPVVIDLTSIGAGRNHTLSGAAGLQYDGSDAAVVDVATDQLTLGSGHGLVTGDTVVYRNGGGTDIGGLTDGQTYFVVIIDDAAGIVQLATTFANATLPVPAFIDLTGVGVGVTHSLTSTFDGSNGGSLGARASITTASTGIDVYRFTTSTPLDFFSVNYQGSDVIKMALFLLDDQGDASSLNDTFEAVTRWEFSEARIEGEFEAFMAFEMPEAGQYYLVVEPLFASGEDYTLDLSRATNDQELVNLLGGNLPRREQIAYISNQVNDANNTLGANTPKQLVYIDFDGGVSTEVDGLIQFGAFDTENFDDSGTDLLDGSESNLINGTGGQFDGSGGVGVDIATDQVFLGAGHGLLTGDQVVYRHGDGGISIGGLANDHIYFVVVVNPALGIIQLATTFVDAIQPVPVVIDLTSNGTGTNHFLGGTAGAPFDGSDAVVVDVATNQVILGAGHGLMTGGQVVYRSGLVGTAIEGLTDGQSYFVAVIDAGLGVVQLATTFDNATQSTPIAIDLTSIGVGTAHSLIGGQTPTGDQFDGSAAAVVDVATDQVTVGPGHNLVTGDQVIYSNGIGGTDIGGLTDGQSYFVVVVNNALGMIQLATSYANATLPVPVVIDLTTVGVGTEHSLLGGATGTGGQFDGSGGVGIDVATDQMVLGASHGLVTGDAVVYSNGGGTNIGGLTDGQTYFVVVIDAGQGIVQLATTLADATQPVPVVIDLTTLGTGNRHSLTGVAGIMENIETIYTTTAASHRAGMLTVQLLGSDLTDFIIANTGLYFTTVDPSGSGLEFATIVVGDPENTVLSSTLFGQAEHVDLANLDKADEAFVATPPFLGQSTASSLTDQLNEYSRAFANVIAHELGHLLGLNHQSSDPLVQDDPDNSAATPFDGNTGTPGLMEGGGFIDITVLQFLGTAPLRNDPSPNNEFALGDIDTADLTLRWLA